MSSGSGDRSTRAPRQTADDGVAGHDAMSAGGGASRAPGCSRTTRARVSASRPSGSCTPTMPPAPHAMAQRPMARVEDRKLWARHAQTRIASTRPASALPRLAVKPRPRRSSSVALPSLRRRIALVSIQCRSSRRGGRMRKTGRMVVAGAALMAVLGVSDRRVAGGLAQRHRAQGPWRVHRA